MQFKKWLYNEILDRNSIRNIILDILDAGKLPDEAQEDVLGSKISEQPIIQKKILTFSILKPYEIEIKDFLKNHQQANLTDLINFIQELT